MSRRPRILDRSLPNFLMTPQRRICRSPNGSATAAIPACLLKIEHLPEPGVVFARRIVQLGLVAEPRIVAAEDAGEPIEYETDRSGAQTLGLRKQKKWNRNPQTEFERHEAGLNEGVGAKQPNAMPRFHQHAVSKRIVAMVRDAPARRRLLPAIPKPRSRGVIFGLDEKMVFEIIAGRQPAIPDIVLGDDRNEVKLAQPSELD